jgi:type II secretory pathway pseudopilin PulG
MKEKLLKKIKSKKEAGFTIIESLVAIFILILSITGPMAFTQSGLRAAFVSRDQITAFFLAQDAIEYIKNVRDNNSINILNKNGGPAINWDTGLGDCVVGSSPIETKTGCTIDTSDIGSENIRKCGSNAIGCLGSDSDGSDDIPLKIYSDDIGDNLYGFLGFRGSIDSIFSREIKMVKINPDEYEINVFIRWNTNETIGSRQIIVKEYIYNWAAGF